MIRWKERACCSKIHAKNLFALLLMGMTSPASKCKRELTDLEDSEVQAKKRSKSAVSKIASESVFKDGCKGPPSPASSLSKIPGEHKKPAEVFRTDFITAMKIPESQTIPNGEYVTLQDTWRQEWEKGVQVAVNPEGVFQPSCREKEAPQATTKRYDAFTLPFNLITADKPEKAQSNNKKGSCNYDLDDLDVEWLKSLSDTKIKKGEIDEITMERAITYFERKCFENMAHAVATKEGLSIEYDETTICDVCLSPDTEDGNEIVFCDACNMCAHQACYGISEIPDGTWLCRPCSRGILSPPCAICPNKGGAMKRVKNSFEWIHIICAWWVPEVKIEDTDHIEKITLDKIPQSRRNLVCNLCRVKMGACIQCSIKRCVKAYHVTCGVKEGLEMKTVMLPEKHDVQHISYCEKHCTPQPPDSHRLRTGEIVENQRLQELTKLEQEFFSIVNLRKAAKDLRLSRESTRKLFSFWALKRKANDNKPLIPLDLEQQEQLSGKQGIVFIQEQMNFEMEKFMFLRQDLERLRNLCYMIIRRERVRRELHKSSQEIFHKQIELLTNEDIELSEADRTWVSSGSDFMNFIRFPHHTIEADYSAESSRTLDEDSALPQNIENEAGPSELRPSLENHTDPLSNLPQEHKDCDNVNFFDEEQKQLKNTDPSTENNASNAPLINGEFFESKNDGFIKGRRRLRQQTDTDRKSKGKSRKENIFEQNSSDFRAESYTTPKKTKIVLPSPSNSPHVNNVVSEICVKRLGETVMNGSSVLPDDSLKTGKAISVDIEGEGDTNICSASSDDEYEEDGTRSPICSYNPYPNTPCKDEFIFIPERLTRARLKTLGIGINVANDVALMR